MLSERGSDHNSHLVKHAIEKNLYCPSRDKFNIIGSNLKNVSFKQKVVECLLIKHLRLSINPIQGGLFRGCSRMGRAKKPSV